MTDLAEVASVAWEEIVERINRALLLTAWAQNP
jgi:hypothetical protein